MTSFKLVIPARLASVRLPEKPLVDLGGQSMIQRVCRVALQAGAEEIIVATDDQKIVDHIQIEGIQTILTNPHHVTGTDRILEVARLLNWSDDTLVVNLQGDEPLMIPELVTQVAELLANNPHWSVSTMAVPIQSAEELINPNAVKVIRNFLGEAVYFSRAPMPWSREGFQTQIDGLTQTLNVNPQSMHPQYYDVVYRHLGLYAYRVSALQYFGQAGAGALDLSESLEQLRFMMGGLRIGLGISQQVPEAGIDTADDLARVRRSLGV
jgi:3-deoxy-manno-octulosonate cytidylyltransferase (CMP-KDO synthetase)